jgi:leukotriene-A4 hydrolase
LDQEKIALLEEAYGLKDCQNSEIMFSFLLIGIKAKWMPVIKKSLEFVKFNGRIKFVKPIYNKLFKWNEAREEALQNFEKCKPSMHPITVIVVKSQI